MLVEGIDDKVVVENLLFEHGFRNSIKIEVKEGFEKLRDSLYSEVNVSGREVLGVLADANGEIDRRWNSISDQLNKAECQVPKKISC